ncbi:Fis family transcriptional regulator [Pseudoxanthomonas taiwanensis J19]|jgi:Factor for inversion stimulation Fis, transcriptional activator|uniref:Putative Fis-like DNA-binding protein n=2 Tax=Lysobacteraceae TaxID=32033 RepID=A0A562D6G6_9GAMM|nr:Fis family transcriptional regulator [Pseudoxanthomonas taiwanensis J19]
MANGSGRAAALDSPTRSMHAHHPTESHVQQNAPSRADAGRSAPRPPLREHVAQSVRRYLRDLDGVEANDVYEIVLREMEIPLFVEVLNHCDGNQSRAAALLGIHRATLRKKLKDYGLV